MSASVDLLNHLGHTEHARVIGNAITQTIVVDKIHTPDLGGTNSSTDIIENILRILSKKRVHW